jgi:hypothetical protein
MQHIVPCQFCPLPRLSRHTHSCVQWFKSALQVQWFLSTYDQIANVFASRQDHDTAVKFRSAAVSRFTIWAKMTGVALETAKVGLSPLQFVAPRTRRLL